MLKFSRNKLVDVSRKGKDTLLVHGVLDDDIYSLELDVTVRTDDMRIVGINGKWHRWTTPECPRATRFLDGAIGLRIGEKGFAQKIHKVVGRKACRHYANLLLECCHCAGEALAILQWEQARHENPHLGLEAFLAGRTGRSEAGDSPRRNQHAGRIRVEPSPLHPETPIPSAVGRERARGSKGVTIDLHVHTCPASPCSNAPVDALIKEAKRIGLDGFCLTDHNHVWKPAEVEELRQRHGFLILRGNEITTTQGDILVFGYDEEVPGIIDVADLRKRVLAAGGFMIVAHPFRGFLVVGMDQIGLTPDRAMERHLFRLMDGVEVLNGKVTDGENELARRVAEGLGLPGTGGSDAHEVKEVGLYATLFPGRITSERDLVAALKDRHYRPVVLRGEKRVGTRPVAR